MNWNLKDVVSAANKAKKDLGRATKHAAARAKEVAESLNEDVLAAAEAWSSGKTISPEKVDAEYASSLARDQLETLFCTFAQETKNLDQSRQELTEIIANHHSPPLAPEIDESQLLALREKVDALNTAIEPLQAELLRFQEIAHQDETRKQGMRQALEEMEKNREAIAKIEEKMSIMGPRTEEVVQKMQDVFAKRQAEHEESLNQIRAGRELPCTSEKELSDAESEITALREKLRETKSRIARQRNAAQNAAETERRLAESQGDIAGSKQKLEALEQKLQEEKTAHDEQMQVLDAEVAQRSEELGSVQKDLALVPKPQYTLHRELKVAEDLIKEQIARNRSYEDLFRAMEQEENTLRQALHDVINGPPVEQLSGSHENKFTRMGSDVFNERLEAAKEETAQEALKAQKAREEAEAELANIVKNVKNEAKELQRVHEEANQELADIRKNLEQEEEKFRAKQEAIAKIRAAMPNAKKVQQAQTRAKDIEEALGRVKIKTEQAISESKAQEKDRERPSLEDQERRGAILSVTVNDTLWVLLGEDGSKTRWWKRGDLFLDDGDIGSTLQDEFKKKEQLIKNSIQEAKQDLENEKIQLTRTEQAFSAFKESISSKFVSTAATPKLGQRDADHKKLEKEVEQMEKEVLREQKKQETMRQAMEEVVLETTEVKSKFDAKMKELEDTRTDIEHLQSILTEANINLQRDLAPLVENDDGEVTLTGVLAEDEAVLQEVRDNLAEARQEVSQLERKISDEKRRIARIKRIKTIVEESALSTGGGTYEYGDGASTHEGMSEADALDRSAEIFQSGSGNFDARGEPNRSWAPSLQPPAYKSMISTMISSSSKESKFQRTGSKSRFDSPMYSGSVHRTSLSAPHASDLNFRRRSSGGSVIKKTSSRETACELPPQAFSLNLESVQDDINKLTARKEAIQGVIEKLRRQNEEEAVGIPELEERVRAAQQVGPGQEVEYFRNVFRSAVETRPHCTDNETAAAIMVLWKFFDFPAEDLANLDKKRAAKESSWWGL